MSYITTSFYIQKKEWKISSIRYFSLRSFVPRDGPKLRWSRRRNPSRDFSSRCRSDERHEKYEWKRREGTPACLLPYILFQKGRTGDEPQDPAVYHGVLRALWHTLSTGRVETDQSRTVWWVRNAFFSGNYAIEKREKIRVSQIRFLGQIMGHFTEKI